MPEDTQPTPEELVQRLQNLGATDAERDATMAGVIADAEAGGTDHMNAVADFICSLPPDPPNPRMPRYDQDTRRPAWHDTNVLLELCATVGGRTFVAREALDAYLFEMRFGDEDEFERYVRYFIGRAFGQVAVSDEQSYRFFRDRLWVVRPQDLHDLRRCVKPGTGPVCDGGLIVRSRVSPIWMPLEVQAIPAPALRPDVLGVCPCRCHEHDGSATRNQTLDRMYLLGTFDESQLDGADSSS